MTVAARRVRVLGTIVAGLLGGAGGPSVAHADPPVPTDFRTVVVAVRPPTESIELTIVGGDSFVELTVDRGTEVIVVGYQGEPYLRFRSDGVVEENTRSPSLYISRDRYGGTAPAEASADLPPTWKQVATGGRYAWHDHRSHLMQPGDPAGAARGDRIHRGRIALLVDGAAVEVAVASDWLAAPSAVPLVAGAGAAGLLVIAALLARRRLTWVLLLSAAAAGGIGWWQFASLPPETGPRELWWALPAVAAGSALLGLVLGRRPVSYALITLGAIELGVWVVIRRDGATKAILPTDAPFWIDRAVLAGAAVAAVVVAAGSLFGLFRRGE